MRQINMTFNKSEIYTNDPWVLMEALGDPRNYDRFDINKVNVGDHAVVVSARPGAIYFMRSQIENGPEDALIGDVFMTQLLLGHNASRGDTILESLVKRSYDLERREGPNMDGIRIPFYVIRENKK